jgi:hypothetical protein
MRLSAVGASLLFSGAFAVAGALVACATGDQVPSGSPTGPTGGGYDASVTDASGADAGGSSDDAPSTVYGDGNAGVDAPATPIADGGTEGGDDAPAAAGPTCAPGESCVDAVPAGWTGYVQLVLQGGDAGSACAAPYGAPQPQLAGSTNPDGGPAGCSPCTCIVADGGVTCSIDLLTGDLLCLGGSGAPMTALQQNQCVQISGFGTSANGGSSEPRLTSGTCQPQGGTVTTAPPPPTSTLATVCGAPTAGEGGAGDSGSGGGGMTCTPSQACAAVPQGQADGGSPSGPCIYQSGVQGCPSGVFMAQFIVGPIDDTRGCGCSCGTPQCPSDGYVGAYASNSCSGMPALVIDAGAKCKGALSETGYKYVLSRSGSQGSCDVDDAGPTGSVTIDAGAATTFCCVP